MAKESANKTGVSPGEARIGWIGTGVIGAAMCGHLIRAGYRLTVHSRTKDNARPLLDQGAQWGDTGRSPAATWARATQRFRS